MFIAAGRDAPEPARFLMAVNQKGEVRYCFLQMSSGDTTLDEQARKYLAATRFPAIPDPATSPLPPLTWGTATIEWGNDVTPAPAASATPNAP